MTERTANEIHELFVDLQLNYATRNAILDEYERYFNGEHWAEDSEGEDETSFQLVFNYCRSVVLKFSAIMCKPPRVRIPVSSPDLAVQARATNRERYLHALWEDLTDVWSDVETNASKKTFGVLEVTWDPGPDEPMSVQVGEGADKSTVKQYTCTPFKFRSVDPNLFYPVYRTYNKPDDFYYTIIYDPDRLIEDIEETYGVSLQPTEQDEGTDGTTDLYAYWDKDRYYLIAYTVYKSYNRRSQKDQKEQGRAVILKEFKHKYGRCPHFVIQNLRDPGKDPAGEGSLGDIDAIAELNKHYNLMQSEAAEEIATNIHRPLVYSSDDHQQDPEKLEMKAGAVYPIGAEEKLEPLAWDPMPQSVQDHMTAVMSGIKDLSFLGDSGFGDYNSGATGVGIQLLLQSLTQIMQLKIPRRLAVLKEVVRFLLSQTRDRLDKDTPLSLWVSDSLGRFGNLQLKPDDIRRDYYVFLDYGNLLPRDQIAFEQNEIYKYAASGQSLWATLDALGFDDPDTEIGRMKMEFQDPVLHPDKVMQFIQAKLAAQQASQQAQPQPQGMPVGPAGPGGGGPPGVGAPQNTAPPALAPGANQMPPGTGGAVPSFGRGGSPNQPQVGGGQPGPSMNRGPGMPMPGAGGGGYG